MGSIKLEGNALLIAGSKSSDPALTLHLDDLRLVFLFLPQQFKWRIISPSETQYRYLDVDALSDEEFSLLAGELRQQQTLLGGSFLLVLKDYGGHSVTLPLKDFVQDGLDIFAELARSRGTRVAKREAWLQQSPHVTVNNITFDLHQAQQGTGKAVPWHALERIEINQTQSLGTNNYFHFIPLQKGIKKFFQGVPSNQIEAFLAEIHFWRVRGTPSETVALAQQRGIEAQQKSKKTMKGLLIALAIVVILGILLVGVAAILMTIL